MFSDDAKAFAEMYYEEIRHFSTDVKKISEILGKDEKDIQQVKNYLFVDKSLYDAEKDEWRTFDPDCAIAQSWQRLMSGKNIQKHDRTLIEHELYEMELKTADKTLSHQEAHLLATRKYNYQKEADEYYGSLKKH